jgi:hypothetical protein
MIPGVATVVVIQSDDLAAWIGVAGVAVGVVLAAGIDWWRNRRAERRQTRCDLLHAGTDLSAAVGSLARAGRAAGAAAKSDPAWMEVVDGRSDAMRVALQRIMGVAGQEVDNAANAIIRASYKAMPDATDQEAFLRYAQEMMDVMGRYRDAVEKAKL